MNRRQFAKSATLAALGASWSTRGLWAQDTTVPTTGGNYSSRTIDLVGKANVVDMLVELDQARTVDGVPLVDHWLSEPWTFTAADAQDYLDSQINVFALGHPLDEDHDVTDWFARWNGFIAGNNEYFDRIDTKDKLRNAGESGRTGILLTLQTAFHFRELNDVNRYHGLGQRVSQLCHNESNHIATAGFDDDDKGLSDFGAEIVERIQDVGMGVDVSHCSDKTTMQTLEIAKRPILFTHAPCRALNPGYARAKTDDMIRKMAATGGVMGVAVLRFFPRDKEPVTIEHFLDHIDHIVKIAGIEHVGIGSDQGLDTEDPYLPISLRHRLPLELV